MTDGQTDGRTDGQNYDSQDRAGIAASCGINHFFYSAYLLNTDVDGDVINTAADRQNDTHRRTKLTAPETISRSRDMVVPAKI